jgi:hypothetical protein
LIIKKEIIKKLNEWIEINLMNIEETEKQKFIFETIVPNIIKYSIEFKNLIICFIKKLGLSRNEKFKKLNIFFIFSIIHLLDDLDFFYFIHYFFGN